jgi:hypothetical protein
MGWVWVVTHLGVTMTGSFWTRLRMISKLALPEPMITPALTQIVWICSGLAERISPVSMRLSRCLLAVFFTPRPPR